MLRWLFGRRRGEAGETVDEAPVQGTIVRDPNAIARMSPNIDSSPAPVGELTGNPSSSTSSPIAEPEYSNTEITPPIGQTVVIIHNRTEKEATIVRAQAGGRRLFVQQSGGPVRVFEKAADIYRLGGARIECAPVLHFQTH